MRFRWKTASRLTALAIALGLLVGCGILPQQKRYEIIYAEVFGADGSYMCNPGPGERVCFNSHAGPRVSGCDFAICKLFEEKPLRYCRLDFSYLACANVGDCVVVQLDVRGEVSAFSMYQQVVHVAIGTKKLKPVMSPIDEVDWSQSNCKTPADFPLN
ncbi:MAG: hypothetical protein Q8S09_10335 [Hyphomonas sp.]|nr:hypothetical protein [Hyphomonas sp.]